LLFAATAQAGPLTWSLAQNVDGANTIEAIDCAPASLCVAGDSNGNVVTSVNPGGGVGTWTVSKLAAAFTTMAAVSCPSTTLCLVVDANGDLWWSTDPNGGAGTWTSAAINGGAPLQSIDCPTISLCVAGGRNNGSVIWSTDPTGGAGKWTPANIDGANGVFSLSCPTTTLCVEGNDVGDIHWTTTPTGLAAAWTAVTGVDPGEVIEGMSCVNETFCVATDDLGGTVTTTNPTGAVGAWTLTNIAGFTAMYSVSCPTTTLCVTGAGSTALSSVDPMGGAGTWGSDALGTSLLAAACPTAAFCVSGGGSGDVYIGLQATLGVALAGAGTGSVSGSGIACPGPCSFIYPLGTPVTLTATPGSDGSTFSGWSGACTGTGTCNLTMAGDRAVTATFDPPPPPPATSSSAPPPSAPAPTTDLPPPVNSQTANAYPSSGTVLVKAAGTKTFAKLVTPQQVQVGAIFDVRLGAVQITIANGRGGFDSATFSQGEFRLVQNGAIAELDLVGGNTKHCPKAAKGGAAVVAVKRGRSIRHLWGEGSGNFRTKGRFASATIRGTRWLTDDRCFGTLVTVAKGAVTVRDLVLRKTLALRAPKSYFAHVRG
jgi:hypothetical protein